MILYADRTAAAIHDIEATVPRGNLCAGFPGRCGLCKQQCWQHEDDGDELHFFLSGGFAGGCDGAGLISTVTEPLPDEMMFGLYLPEELCTTEDDGAGGVGFDSRFQASVIVFPESASLAIAITRSARRMIKATSGWFFARSTH